MSGFSEALDAYAAQSKTIARWDKCLPDEIYGTIATSADFADFVSFVAGNWGGDFFEVGSEDASEFFLHFSEVLRKPTTAEYARGIGINTDFGLIAYAIVLALGNR